MYSSCSFRLLPILVPLKSNGRIKQIKKVPKLQILKIKKMTAYLIHSIGVWDLETGKLKLPIPIYTLLT